MTTTPYFSHDVNAQRDDKCVRLLQTLGWKGYGVYWALVERLHEQKECVLEYNPKGLAWSLHISEKYLIRVATEFGLFEFSEDGSLFWSNSAKRRRAYRTRNACAPKSEQDPEQPKRKRGRPRKNPDPVVTDRLETVVEPAGREPVAQNALAHESEPEQSPSVASVAQPAPKTPQSGVQEQTGLITPAADSVAAQGARVAETTKNAAPQKELATIPMSDASAQPVSLATEAPAAPKIPVESLIASWNQIFSGTRQTYKGLYLDGVAFQRARETFSLGYTFERVEEAFRIARGDSFCWLLKDVLKPDNIQRLLVKGDKANAHGSKYGADSVFGLGSGSQASLPDDDWGNPERWTKYELRQD